MSKKNKKKRKVTIFEKIEESALIDLIISYLSRGEVSDKMYAKIATLLIGYPVVTPDSDGPAAGKFEIQWGKR